MGKDRGHLLTEQRNDRSKRLDRADVAEAFDILNAEDALVAGAVRAAKPQICAAVRLVAEAFTQGGRLIYVGAGTSGRLGVLDAAECPPTFLSDPEMVQGVIAGGREAMFRSVEAAEDDSATGAKEMDARSVGPKDVVFGVATGGTTPFVHAALERARGRGAKTVFLACVSRDEAGDAADVSIRVLTGPEVLTGSTRMKAGIATKMVMNTVSTLAMVQIGKVYENLMVDVNAQACSKLVDRGARIVSAVTGLDRASALALQAEADGQVKVAIVMQACGVGKEEAKRLLAANGGSVRAVLGGEV